MGDANPTMRGVKAELQELEFFASGWRQRTAVHRSIIETGLSHEWDDGARNFPKSLLKICNDTARFHECYTGHPTSGAFVRD